MNKIPIKLKKPKLVMRPVRTELETALETLNPNTAKSYRNSILRVAREVFKQPHFNHLESIKHHDRIVQFYENNPSRRTLIGAMIHVYELLGVDPSCYDDLKQKSNEWVEFKKEATPKETAKIIGMSEFYSRFLQAQTLFEQCPTSRELYSDYVIMALYWYLPPIRQSEYCDTKFVNWAPMDHQSLKSTVRQPGQPANVYCLTNQKLVISKSKTSKTYGVRVIEVPPALHQILVKGPELFQCQYLISLKTMPQFPMRPEQVTHTLNRLVHAGFSVDQLRQVYITEHCNHINQLECNQLAFIMGHSVTTQQLVYKRFKAEQLK